MAKFQAKFELVPRRNYVGVLVFDIMAPLGTLAGLVLVGVVLGWPLWWVSVCSMLVLLIVAGAGLDVWWWRRRSVSFGTDQQHPALRVVLAGLCAAALTAAAVLAYAQWMVIDDHNGDDSTQVVRVATDISVAAGTISPGDPGATVARAADMMAPDRAAALKDKIGRTAADLASRDTAVQAVPLFTGVEELTGGAARVVTVLQSTQSEAGQQVHKSVVPVRVWLAKRDGQWLVTEMAPVHIG